MAAVAEARSVAVHLVAAAVLAVEASEVEDKTNKQRKEYYE